MEPIPDRTPLPPEARAIANEAFSTARAEGCNCDPAIMLAPIPMLPFWRATVDHDDWCKLVRRLVEAGAPLDTCPMCGGAISANDTGTERACNRCGHITDRIEGTDT